MAETNISADKTEGQKIQAEHVNELKNAMVTTFSGRDASGTMAANQQLGSATFPWGLAYINSLISNGKLIDFNLLTTEPNIIKSGKTRSTSDLPDFVRASGSSNSATIQGATTNLTCVINGVTTVLTTDSVISSLTTASTGAANECLINDTTIADQLDTKYLGDGDTFIAVDTMGANISAKVGEYICLKSSTEFMLAYVESTTKLTNIKRGFFFDSNGDPIVRETLANNDVLSLMSLGWVFLEDDGSTLDVSYNSPVYDFVQPSSPSTGDYWFDLQNKQWRRYDGANFVVIKRILIGLVVIDSANCIASRSLDFDLSYNDINSIDFNITPFTSEIIQSKRNNNIISVNGNTLEQKTSKVEFNITTDRDTGVSETSNTLYYMYISQDGQNIISDEKPYSFNAKLRGQYHPYQSWRCVGSFINDDGSNILSVKNVANIFANDQLPSNFNYVINGNGIIRQLSDLTLTTSFGYGKGDMVAAKATGTITSGVFTAEDFNTESWFKFENVTLTGGSDKLHAITPIEAQNVKSLINSSATISCKIHNNVGADFTAAIKISKANTSDVFTALTEIETSQEITCKDGVDTELELNIADMGDCSNGVAIEIICSTGAITNKDIYVTNIKLENGLNKTKYLNRKISKELLDCQRYLRKTYNIFNPPGTITTSGQLNAPAGRGFTASASIEGHWHFTTKMRTTPSATFYNGTTGAVGTWRDSGGLDVAMGVAGSGDSVINYRNTASCTLNSIIGGHIVADARLTF